MHKCTTLNQGLDSFDHLGGGKKHCGGLFVCGLERNALRGSFQIVWQFYFDKKQPAAAAGVGAFSVALWGSRVCHSVAHFCSRSKQGGRKGRDQWVGVRKSNTSKMYFSVFFLSLVCKYDLIFFFKSSSKTVNKRVEQDSGGITSSSKPLGGFMEGREQATPGRGIL